MEGPTGPGPKSNGFDQTLIQTAQTLPVFIRLEPAPGAWWAPQDKGIYQTNAGEAHEWSPAPLPEAFPSTTL